MGTPHLPHILGSLLLGYALLTLYVFILPVILPGKRSYLTLLDWSSCLLIRILSLVYFIVSSVLLAKMYVQIEVPFPKDIIITIISWFKWVFTIFILVTLIIPSLLWLRVFRQNIWFRILSSLIIIIGFTWLPYVYEKAMEQFGPLYQGGNTDLAPSLASKVFGILLYLFLVLGIMAFAKFIRSSKQNV